MSDTESTSAASLERKLGARRFAKESVVRLGGVALGIWQSVRLDQGERSGTTNQSNLNALVGKRLDTQRSHRYKDMLISDPTLASSIEQAYSMARYWHGTGRYHRREDGSTEDLLRGILNNGLKPALDKADMVQGPGESISVTNARMYARIYAQTHSSSGHQLDNYYGSQSFWGGVFNGATLHDLVRGGEAWGLTKNVAQNNLNTHGQHRTKDRGVSRTNYVLGSDIPSNYPILIGIKEDAFEPVEISKYLARYEERSKTNITTNHFTHIECPFENIEETQQLLRDINIDLPVLPLEATEEYVAQFAFTELASGALLKAPDFTLK